MQQKTEFIIGYQSVKEFIAKRPYRILRCLLQESRVDKRLQEIQDELKTNKINTLYLSRKEMDAILGTDNHQGFALECSSIAAKSESFLEDLLLKSNLLLLFLDGVQDPHNLGAILRSANAMGVDAVIAPRDRACGLTEVVHKTACGATVHTPFVQVTNLARTLRQTKESGVEIIGMDAQAPTLIQEIQLSQRVGLVMGGEGQGMRRLTREQCDLQVCIPMYGTVESLNVSIATAIGLYEINKIIRRVSSK